MKTKLTTWALAVLSALGALTFLLSPTPSVSASGPAICDVQLSPLCQGLGAVYAFEEATDNPRWDENKGSAWLEADGQNVASATGKTDSYAASFVGTAGNYLYIPRGGGAIGGSTISMWIYPTSNSAEQIILSADEDKKPAPYIGVIPSGSGVQVKYTLPYGNSQGSAVITNSTVLSLNTWYLVTFGYGPNPAPDFTTSSQTGNIAYVQINDLPKQYVNLAYFTTGYGNDLVLGQRGVGTGSKAFSGRVDQLTFVGRQWELSDVSAFYQSGSGATYPFTVLPTINLNSQLVAYWKMDETSGARVDSVGDHDLPACSSSVTGKLSNACRLNTNVNIQTPSSADFNLGSVDWSIVGWFYIETLQNQNGILLVSAGLYPEFNHAGTGYTTFYFNSGGSCSYTTNTPGTGWHHFAMAWTDSGTVGKTYIDGSLANTTSGCVTHSPGGSSTYIQLGYSTNYQTDYDELGIYRRAITAAEATALYNGGTGRSYPF